MISRAANRTSSERSSSTSLRPAISALSFSRVRSDAGILSIGVLLCGGRSPNRTSLVRLIRRRCTPTLFPASLGLHQPGCIRDRHRYRVEMLEYPRIVLVPERDIEIRSCRSLHVGGDHGLAVADRGPHRLAT